MFGIEPVYRPGKDGEARDTLCTSSEAHECLGWNPQKDLVYYIKQLNTKSYDSALDAR